MSKTYTISYRAMPGNLMVQRRIRVGSKIWFRGEKQGYTVQASNIAFCVLTKPFNARNTVLYCIIDWESAVRGPSDSIFNPYDLETEEGCRGLLDDITMGKCEVSSRHCAVIDIVAFKCRGERKIYREATKEKTKGETE